MKIRLHQLLAPFCSALFAHSTSAEMVLFNALGRACLAHTYFRPSYRQGYCFELFHQVTKPCFAPKYNRFAFSIQILFETGPNWK